MPPTPSTATPRIIVYYQTHHTPDDDPISILPFLTTPNIHLTHLILAAIHLNHSPDSAPHLTLNDHIPSHPRNQTLWAELSVLRASGVKVLGMLGGAAKGTFTILDSPSVSDFEAAYKPLRAFVTERELDGLDLDVEEEMSLQGIIRLIDRLKKDFGHKFIITLAPVAAALLDVETNLSGFDYGELEMARGSSISWYNAQFYCGWGDMYSTAMFDAIIWKGWRPDKVVVGLITNPENGGGWVPMLVLRLVFGRLKQRYGAANGAELGGVMGWEYFNALPGGKEKPWEWARSMTGILRGSSADELTAEERIEAEKLVTRRAEEIEGKKTMASMVYGDGKSGEEAALPTAFEYFSDKDGDDREDVSLPRSFEYFTDDN